MYRSETLLFFRSGSVWVLVLFVWGFWLGCFGCLFCVFEFAEFLPLAKMTCAHRTHGVSTRAKKTQQTHHAARDPAGQQAERLGPQTWHQGALPPSSVIPCCIRMISLSLSMASTSNSGHRDCCTSNTSKRREGRESKHGSSR